MFKLTVTKAYAMAADKTMTLDYKYGDIAKISQGWVDAGYSVNSIVIVGQ